MNQPRGQVRQGWEPLRDSGWIMSDCEKVPKFCVDHFLEGAKLMAASAAENTALKEKLDSVSLNVKQALSVVSDMSVRLVLLEANSRGRGKVYALWADRIWKVAVSIGVGFVLYKIQGA